MNQHNETPETWDMVIKPKKSILQLNLGEVWKYRDLMWLLVRRDFVAAYRQTILGPIWHFIQPIFTTIMFLFVFTKVAKIPTDGVNPVIFYMSGITIWNYFSTCVTATSSTFIANAGIFGKVYFPRMVMPISIVLSSMVKFGIQMLLLFSVMAYYGIQTHQFYFGISWLLIPVLVIMMAALGLGAGIIISSLTTKYRDFTVLIGFAIQLLMYATPVAYPLSYLRGTNYYSIIKRNPLTPMVEGFRYALFHSGQLSIPSLISSLIFIIITLIIGLVLFNRVERTFMDTV
jgi:lipopolysaccharide transport system permease protein